MQRRVVRSKKRNCQIRFLSGHGASSPPSPSGRTASSSWRRPSRRWEYTMIGLTDSTRIYKLILAFSFWKCKCNELFYPSFFLFFLRFQRTCTKFRSFSPDTVSLSLLRDSFFSSTNEVHLTTSTALPLVITRKK